MDNINIPTETLEENVKLMKQVLRVLQDNDLFVKAEKCIFFLQKIKFLELIISEDGIAMNEEKIDTIKTWPVPKSIKELQLFLGFVNFYH